MTGRSFVVIPHLLKDIEPIIFSYLSEPDKIKLLFAHGGKCKFIERFSEIAALNGNLVNMKWLKENNCPWGTWTFRNAAHNGNLDNMKWLKENNCPWDKLPFNNAAMDNTFEAAARNGN